jgi:hypothetical protein
MLLLFIEHKSTLQSEISLFTDGKKHISGTCPQQQRKGTRQINIKKEGLPIPNSSLAARIVLRITLWTHNKE